ncbi:unnamed protein product [Meloidogyne enterolobii]|uniref:Uncharacterized protein n=1 Tax=Meloidogyne enterolobii TaxID=390850 RepID=A0ACB0YHQ9_MELEN
MDIILDFFKFLVEEIIPNFNLEEVSDIIVALKMLTKSVYKIAECYYKEQVDDDAGDDVGGSLE